jgi:hypothetical protein
MREHQLRIDVTDAVGLGELTELIATVFLPDEIPAAPIACFAFPGGGYSRRYFSMQLNDGRANQARWHTDRGWIFIACDYLNAGDSTCLADPGQLTYEHLGAANHALVLGVRKHLATGLASDVKPITDPIAIGIGQSLGGAILIVQQGQQKTFDAVAILGWSARQSVLWTPPGTISNPPRYIARGTDVLALTPEVHHAAIPQMAAGPDGLPLAAPGFHYDDVARELVAADMVEYPTRRGEMPDWGTAMMPPCAMTMMSPGALAPEAASIDVPVFIGVGERDVCPNPHAEPGAYPRATDVTVFVCPRMSHMHNFASTRERLWARLHSWGSTVVEQGTVASAGTEAAHR